MYVPEKVLVGPRKGRKGPIQLRSWILEKVLNVQNYFYQNVGG